MALMIWSITMALIIVSLWIANRIAHDGYTKKRTIAMFGFTAATIISMFCLLWGVLMK